MKMEEQEKKLGLRRYTNHELGQEAWKKLWEKIEAKEVTIPPNMLPLINRYLLNTNTLWERGDLSKITDFLELFGLWYQRQLPKYMLENGEYAYILTPKVFVKAIQILQRFFGIGRRSGVDERILRTLELAKKYAEESETLEETSDSAYIVNKEIIEKIAEKMKKSSRTIRRYLKAAYESGLVDAAIDSNGRISHYILRPNSTNNEEHMTDSRLWVEAWKAYNDFVRRFEHRIEEEDELAAAFNYLFSRPKNEQTMHAYTPLDKFVTAATPEKMRKIEELTGNDTVTSRDKPECHKLEGIGIGLNFEEYKEIFVRKLDEEKLKRIAGKTQAGSIIYFLEAEKEALAKALDLGLLPIRLGDENMEVMV